MSDSEAAARLKDEGNKHFEKKEFSQAYDKYTAALKKGGDSAILYANRAACLLSLRKFLDATNDAQKATELDPTYSKGWGRLASAYMGINKCESAKNAYLKAIECLQDTNRTPAQEKQKKQYEIGLREAEELLRTKKAELHVVNEENVKYTPWELAAKILKRMDLQFLPSSAWTIGKAYEEWEEGMTKMRLVKQVKLANGVLALFGALDVITCLTNAILRDRRVFHIADSNWMEMFERQALYETQFSNGWVNVGPKIVLEEAQARVKRDGWEGKPDAMGMPKGGVRQAMGSQVRIWIMQAFVLNGLKNDNLGTETLYSDTLDFLEKGRKIWAGVPREDRGAMFDDTFIRGIKVLHLEAYMGATKSTMKGKYTLKKLFEVAKDLFDEASVADENKPTFGDDPGFIASFYTYPAGKALSTMAFCFREMASAEDDEEKKKGQLKQAGLLFHQSTKYFFEDDEYYCQYSTISLGCYWKSGAGLDVTLPIMKALKSAAPKMMKIWAQSALSKDGRRDQAIGLCLDFYEEVLDKISRAELTENAQYLPPDFTISQSM